MKATRNIFLTKEEFDFYLDIALVIVSYPSKRKQYYVCNATGDVFGNCVVNVYVSNKTIKAK